jgi:AAA domain-containing protein
MKHKQLVVADMENSCGICFLIHGPSKAGKSYLGDSAPGPRLILDAEGGTRFLKSKKTFWEPTQPPPEYDGSWETCITYVRDFQTLSYAYQWLAAGKHPFKSVIIDSLSEAQQRCVDAIAGAEAMQLRDWGELYRKVAQVARQFRDLLVHPTAPLDAVVLLAMTKQGQDGKFYPYVQGQLATALPYFVDVVGFLKAQISEEGEFTNFLLTKPHIQYEAGDRTGVYPQVITNPRIDQMIDQFCNPTQSEAN